jgi:hypothetical protein
MCYLQKNNGLTSNHVRIFFKQKMALLQVFRSLKIYQQIKLYGPVQILNPTLTFEHPLFLNEATGLKVKASMSTSMAWPPY